MVFVACETPAPTNLNGPAPAEGATATAVEGEEATAGVIRAREVTEAESEGSTRTVGGSLQELLVRGGEIEDGQTVGNSISLGTPVVENGEVVGFQVGGTTEPLSATDGDPLVYLDGVRLSGSLRSFDIDPEEIARIEVIKGPAAETLYGAEAAGGVIQIFTKDWVAENEPGRAEPRTIREHPSTVSPMDEPGGEDRPLIYVDGVRIDDVRGDREDAAGRVLQMIDPEDIDRIEVIKGAAATAIYGVEAAGGVIQIYTKDGGGAGEAEAEGEFRVQEIREWEGELRGGEEADGGAYRFEARAVGPDEEPETWRMRMTPND